MIRQRKEGEEKDCPLSIDGWMMFLNGKINAIETRLYTLWAVIIAVLVALVGGSIAFTNSCIRVPIHGATLDIPTGLILLLFSVVVYLFLLKYCKKTQKEVEPLETLRDDILKGLKDSNEILKRYLDAVGKSGEEKDLEKSNKEQKEVMQAMQRDMSNLKRRMEEIAISNSFCVFGSLLVAVGLAIIFVQTLPNAYILSFAGLITFVLGLLFIVVGVKCLKELNLRKQL